MIPLPTPPRPAVPALAAASLALLAAPPAPADEPVFHTAPVFPYESWHNHGSCVVEMPAGGLLVCWFHGSGERTADDVQVLGAHLAPGARTWSRPFVMADTPGFPDTNCCMIIDPDERLWLLWPTIQANLWESALMKIRRSRDYQRPGEPPLWESEEVLHIKPGEPFEELVRQKTAEYLSHRQLSPGAIEWAAHNFAQASDKLTRRLGWFTRAHPYITAEGRLVVGLYSDGFSFSLAAFTDDWGGSWGFSDPIVGGGNIQPSFARRADGGLVAYMRDNGPPPKRVHVSESRDQGETWSTVTDHPVLPNPGAGLELMNTGDGRFLVVYNDSEAGRHQLAVALSEDEGATFRWQRYIEKSDPGQGRFHYPSVIQARDGSFHVTYSAFVKHPTSGDEQKTIKHAQFNLAWLTAGEG